MLPLVHVLCAACGLCRHAAELSNAPGGVATICGSLARLHVQLPQALQRELLQLLSGAVAKLTAPQLAAALWGVAKATSCGGNVPDDALMLQAWEALSRLTDKVCGHTFLRSC